MKNGNGVVPPADAAQDVGLIFVREYYTFLNKKPQRLHGFYSKDSLFIRGDEGEEADTYHGQEEIRRKIQDLNFDDCKVLVTQVDSQLSANNGIIIQVLGEMCNKDQPSQKFGQTFFLAPQHNGYYVLNDIFRFLKEEIDVNDYACEDDEPEPIPQHDAELESPQINTAPRAPEAGLVTPSEALKKTRELGSEPRQVFPMPEEPAATQLAPTAHKAAAPVSKKQPHGAAPAQTEHKGEHKAEHKVESKAENKAEPKAEPKAESKHDAKADAKKEPKTESKREEKADQKTESKGEQKPEPKSETKSEKAEKHEPSSKHPAKQQQQHGANNKDDKSARPNAPKTWANLAATESQKWGPHVAEAKSPVAAVPASTKPQQQQTAPQTHGNHPQQQDQVHSQQQHRNLSPQPSAQQQHQQAQGQPQRQQHGNVHGHGHGHGAHGHGHGQSHGHGPKDQSKDEATQIFVKNVGAQMTEDHLREAFLKFGTVKHINITHSRNCAYVDFATPEACQKALAQHKVNVGNAVVLAEERRHVRQQYNRQQQTGRPYERRFQQEGPHRRGPGNVGAGRGGGNPAGQNAKRGANTSGQM